MRVRKGLAFKWPTIIVGISCDGQNGRSTRRGGARRERRRAKVYSKPRVERFGTFRELTQQGFQGATDGITFNGVNGNNCQNVFLANGQTTLVCIVGGGSAQP